MLRACVLEYGSKWEDCLPFAEFSYNNSYPASLQMDPFEFMYGRKCCTPLNWSDVGESQIFGPDIYEKRKRRFTRFVSSSRQPSPDKRVTPTRDVETSL